MYQCYSVFFYLTHGRNISAVVYLSRCPLFVTFVEQHLHNKSCVHQHPEALGSRIPWPHVTPLASEDPGTSRSFVYPSHAAARGPRLKQCLFAKMPWKQGEPENPKDKPDTRKPIFYLRLILRVHFVIRVTIST